MNTEYFSIKLTVKCNGFGRASSQPFKITLGPEDLDDFNLPLMVVIGRQYLIYQMY